jgi:integrase
MSLSIRSVSKKVNGKTKRLWRWAYFGVDGKPKFITGKTKSVVEVLAKKKVDEIGLEKTSSSQIFLSEAWQQYYRSLNQRKLDFNDGKNVKAISQNTIDEYTSQYLNHIITKLGNIDLRLLTDAVLNDFVSYLVNNTNLDNGTRRKIFNVLTNIVQHQVNPPQSKLAKNVCKDKDYMVSVQVVKSKKKPVIDFNTWSLDMVSNLVSDISNTQVKLISEIMLQTACRPSEARALNRNSFKFHLNIPTILFDKAVKKGKVVGGTKTDSGVRTLTISTSLKDRIQDYINKLPVDQDYLFLNSRGKFICVEQLISHLDKALAKNRVQLPIKRKSYFFRHYTATYWAYTKKHKGNALDLARDLGDKDINFVNENYIKPFKQNDNCVEDLDYQNKHFN